MARTMSKLVLIPALILGIAGCGNESGAKWYDYGNGKVNLNQVSHIKPNYSYQLTLASDALEDINRNYSEPMTETATDNILSLLTLEEITKQPFYRIQVKSTVHFDMFELTLFQSEEYIKRPSQYQVNDYLLKKVADIGADKPSIDAIAALKGKTYSSQEAFIEALATTNALNMDNYWVANELPVFGLGEAGAQFYKATQDVKKDNLLDEAKLNDLRKGIKDALKNYQDIPTS